MKDSGLFKYIFKQNILEKINLVQKTIYIYIFVTNVKFYLQNNFYIKSPYPYFIKSPQTVFPL